MSTATKNSPFGPCGNGGDGDGGDGGRLRKKRFVIDGIFLTKTVTGTQRFAREILRELDRIPEAPSILTLLVPECCWEEADTVPFTMHIPVVFFGKHKGRIWEQTDLPRYLQKTRSEGLYLENTIPLLYRKGIVVLHDVCLLARPDFFRGTLRGRLSLLWRRLMYKAIADSDVRVLTVSRFSKSEIVRLCQIPSRRIRVACCGWQHMLRIGSDMAEIPGRFAAACGQGAKDSGQAPQAPYIFTISSGGMHKNPGYLVRAAQKNPSIRFVAAGTSPFTGEAGLPNLTLLGRISDSEMARWMQGAEAFLFPSFYEGFGMPPLEAAAAGAKRLILSGIPVLREIYGEDALYIDPEGSGEELGEYLKTPPGHFDALLGRYSWTYAAQQLYALLEDADGTGTE